MKNNYIRIFALIPDVFSSLFLILLTIKYNVYYKVGFVAVDRWKIITKLTNCNTIYGLKYEITKIIIISTYSFFIQTIGNIIYAIGIHAIHMIFT